MIQLIVSGINGDDDVAKLTEELSNIGSINQIMVTLGTDSRATVIVTGKASDDEMTEACQAGRRLLHCRHRAGRARSPTTSISSQRLS